MRFEVFAVVIIKYAVFWIVVWFCSWLPECLSIKLPSSAGYLLSAMLVIVRVVTEYLERDIHFTVTEAGEEKHDSACSLSVTSNCTVSKTDGALPSVCVCLTTLSKSDY
jgi:hypothetical protein